MPTGTCSQEIAPGEGSQGESVEVPGEGAAWRLAAVSRRPSGASEVTVWKQSAP